MNNKEIEDFLGNLDFDKDSDEYLSKNFFSLLKIIKDENAFNFIISKNKKINSKHKKINMVKKFNLINSNVCMSNEYITSAFNIALLMIKMGYKFSNKELTRIFLCGFMSNGKTNILYLFKTFKESKNKEFSSNLKNILDIVKDNDKTKELVANYLDSNIVKNPIWQDVFNLLSKLVVLDEVNLNPIINRNIGYLSDAIGKLNNSYSLSDMDMETKISKDLVKKVYAGIPEDVKRENLPYELYKNLNKNVIYNPTFYLSNQNTNNESLDCSIDTYVTGKSWAEAYAYLLAKEGFRTYVSNLNSLHKKVVFFDDNNNMYVADGTYNSFNKHQLFDICDISRAKLDLDPNLFYMVDANDKGQTRNRYYYNNEFLYEDQIIKMQKEFYEDERKSIKSAVSLLGKFHKKRSNIDKENQANSELQKLSGSDRELKICRDIIKFMEKTNNIPDFLQNIPGQNINEVNKKKLELINIITLAVSSKYKDDESIVYDCLKNLIYLLYKKDNDVNVLVGDILPESNYKYKQIKLSNNLYKIVDNRVKLVPILYLKQDDELIYYIWCADNGLQPISKNEITKKIQEGEFHIKDNKSLHKKMAIQFFADGQSAGR